MEGGGPQGDQQIKKNEIRGGKVKELATTFEKVEIRKVENKKDKVSDVRRKWDEIVKNSREEADKRKERVKLERKATDAEKTKLKVKRGQNPEHVCSIVDFVQKLGGTSGGKMLKNSFPKPNHFEPKT